MPPSRQRVKGSGRQGGAHDGAQETSPLEEEGKEEGAPGLCRVEEEHHPVNRHRGHDLLDFRGVQHSVLEGVFRHPDDAVASSSSLPQKADAGAGANASVALVGPYEGVAGAVGSSSLAVVTGVVRHHHCLWHHLTWRRVSR